MAAAWITNLITRRDWIAAKLAGLQDSGAGGLPNVSGEGVNVDHVGQRRAWLDELKQINETLDAVGAGPKQDNDDAMGIVYSEEYP